MFDREAYVDCYENSIVLFRKTLESELKAASGKLIEHLVTISAREFERRSSRTASPRGLSAKDQRDVLEILGEDIAAKIGTVAKVHVENHHRFKNEIHNEINPFDIMKCNSIEEIEDNQRRIIKEYEIRKKYKRVFRSHFKRLDLKSFEILSALYDNEVPSERLGEAIGRISGYDIDTLNQKLSNFLSSYSKDLEYFVNLIDEEDIDAEVLYHKDGVLLLSIDSSEAAASALAKGDWCIADEGFDYYDDYLVHGDSSLEVETREEDNNRDGNGNYANELDGKHFYAYDFNLPESDSCRYIAFTVSASGDVSAAFDKNNKNIKGTVRFDTLTEKYLGIARKHATYDFEQIKKMKWDLSEILVDSNMMTHNFYDPLEAFRYFVSEGKVGDYGFSFMSNALDKSIRNAEDPVRLIDNIFWLSDFFKQYEHDSEYDYDEFGIPEYEYVDDSNFIAEKDLESTELLSRPKVGDIISQLTDLQRDILFKKQKDDIESIAIAHIISAQRSLGGKLNLENGAVNNFARNVISSNKDLGDSAASDLTLLASLSDNFDESLLDNLFKEKNHTANVRASKTIMDNMERFPQSVKDKFIEYLNTNNLDLELSSRRLNAIACDEDFLSKLNSQGVENIRSCSRVLEITDHYSEFTVFGKPNFLERMRRLYKVGAIDDYTLDHCLRTSGIAICEMEVRDESGNKVPGLDFKDYIRGKREPEIGKLTSSKPRVRP